LERTQRLSRRVFLSLRAACNPRGLLAEARTTVSNYQTPKPRQTTYIPFLLQKPMSGAVV
jgi:hypothetical protein